MIVRFIKTIVYHKKTKIQNVEQMEKMDSLVLAVDALQSQGIPATYTSLADYLGVSTKTIQRKIAQNKNIVPKIVCDGNYERTSLEFTTATKGDKIES